MVKGGIGMCMESKGYRVVGTRGILGLVKEGYPSQVNLCKYIQPGKQSGGVSSVYIHRTDIVGILETRWGSSHDWSERWMDTDFSGKANKDKEGRAATM